MKLLVELSPCARCQIGLDIVSGLAALEPLEDMSGGGGSTGRTARGGRRAPHPRQRELLDLVARRRHPAASIGPLLRLKETC
jgi:hypothetical protein